MLVSAAVLFVAITTAAATTVVEENGPLSGETSIMLANTDGHLRAKRQTYYYYTCSYNGYIFYSYYRKSILMLDHLSDAFLFNDESALFRIFYFSLRYKLGN